MTAEIDRSLEEARRLRATLARLQRRLRGERSSGEIGLAPFSALGCLHRNGAMSAGQLAAHERLQPQSLTRILAALGDRGLVARTPDPADRRRSLIEITAVGTTLLRREVARGEAWLADALRNRLTPVERDLIALTVGLLDRLADDTRCSPDTAPHIKDA